jgi:hypothetical protein
MSSVDTLSLIQVGVQLELEHRFDHSLLFDYRIEKIGVSVTRESIQAEEASA